MGFRTVIVLNNDLAHQWQADDKLGDKIWDAASNMRGQSYRFQYGQVIEQVHADTETVALLDHYGGEAVAWDRWSGYKPGEDFKLKMLKQFAKELGYTVRKRPERKQK